ncbi:hypothetical protein R1flu_022766 [Riccia fluitans]|uniref:Uncharacterized protein n=1 Tax=Riccia fluitans TaxID=41844 RepID=A0ABD1XQ65_9MARC
MLLVAEGVNPTAAMIAGAGNCPNSFFLVVRKSRSGSESFTVTGGGAAHCSPDCHTSGPLGTGSPPMEFRRQLGASVVVLFLPQ